MSRYDNRLAVRDFIHKELGLSNKSYNYQAECKVKRVKGKGVDTVKECTVFLIDSNTKEILYASPTHDYNTPHFSLSEFDLMRLAILIHEDIKNKQ